MPERIWDIEPKLAAAAESERRRYKGRVSLEDFYAYMPMHKYVFVPTRDLWPAASVNARIPAIKLTDERGKPVLDDNRKQVTIRASAYLDRHKPVEQMTWAPGQPLIIQNRLMFEGGWIERRGVKCLNLYRPPTIVKGDPAKADKWLAHIKYIYPDDADHIVAWLAHRVQAPHEKINHALVLGGAQGIGKDTLLEPVKHAIGPWNFREASPIQILGRFNSYLRSVVLRISEARDLGESDRFKFYDHLKAFAAAPPDVLRLDEKHLREYSILNCCGIIITTNYKTDGIYLPSDDRRHYVGWSERTKDDERFQGSYWDDLWAYYANGGFQHVAAYLRVLDLSRFQAKAPPPKTPAFWAIVDSNRAPEEAEVADLLDSLGNPRAMALNRLQSAAEGEFGEWIRDRRNRRTIPHRLETCGYVPVRNPEARDGLWKLNGRRQAVYAKAELSLQDQIAAAQAL